MQIPSGTKILVLSVERWSDPDVHATVYVDLKEPGEDWKRFGEFTACGGEQLFRGIVMNRSSAKFWRSNAAGEPIEIQGEVRIGTDAPNPAQIEFQ